MDDLEFREGMMVRIKDDLTETYGRYGRAGDGSMDRMRGRVFPIRVACGQRVEISERPGSFKFTFHKSDVEPAHSYEIEDIEIPDPVTFDPTNLDI